MAGQFGTPFLSDYSAAKAGAIGMMESLRMELKRAGKTGVVCTTICPFFINTGMFDGVRGSMFFPFLDQEETIRRMVAGILQNEEHVNIPWRTGFLIHLMKALFPPAMYDYVCAMLMGWDAMAEFRGRQEKNAIFQTGGK
jgi:short-subunit dehydrogenase